MNYQEAFSGISTCDLSDACDALGVTAATSGQIKAAYPGCPPICGPVFTCRMSPKGEKEIVIGTIEPILAADPGSIFLVDAGGDMENNTVGSLVAVVAAELRMAGAISDGCVRDVQGSMALGFPMYRRSSARHTGPRPWSGGSSSRCAAAPISLPRIRHSSTTPPCPTS